MNAAKITRRELLKCGASAGLLAMEPLAGCFSPRAERRVFPSELTLPRPFQVALPRLTTLRPEVFADGVARLALEAGHGSVSIFRGKPATVAGYNGLFPGPVIEARSGQRLLLCLANRLPHPIVNHLHGGRTEAASDGYPTDLVDPLPADAVMPALEKVTGGASGRGWRVYDYSNQQRAAMLWYHDHRMDFTGMQVWKGLAGVYLLRDAEEEELGLPAGEREVVLVLTDRSFNAHGEFQYPVGPQGMLDPYYMGGVMGDVLLVNGAPWPTQQVQAAMYRMRLLNASNSREYTLSLDHTMPVGYQFAQIGTDGGLLHKILFRHEITLAPGERADVLVNFAGCEPGTPVRMLNLQGEGRMGLVMEWVSTERSVAKDKPLPERLSSSEPPTAHEGMVQRSFDFKYLRRKGIWTVNGLPYDPDRIDARPKLGTTEIWHLRSDFTHPVHLHLVHFGVLQHDGRPRAGDQGWKDTLRLVAGESATIIVPFTGFPGKYVFHCHNLEHEDMRMMANFEVVA